ncbi:TMEM175 family protein [Streptomyces sp. NPDC048664]|uniref:TMEM175 family protein n=1 Tax=Streptomyces sp. NPDC048664 TaxID=3154505 RepID=UPI00341F3AF8
MAETTAPRPGATQEEPEEARHHSSERLVFFSDAVIAIAITLLALELPIPGEGVHGNAGVLRFLHEHLPEYLAFLVSFTTIATHWMAHQRLFRYATGTNGRVVRWNLVWLLMIVSMPFTTRLLTSEADAFQVQFTIYAAAQALAGLCLTVAFAGVLKSGLLRPRTPPAGVADALAWVTTMVVTFVLSIPVALITPWASLCWVLFPLVRIALRPVERRIADTVGALNATGRDIASV